MGNASVKARGHGHIHNTTRRHNKRFRRTKHKHRYNRGGGLNPDKPSAPRSKKISRKGFHSPENLGRLVLLREQRKADAEVKQQELLKKVNNESRFTRKQSKKPVVHKMATFEEEE